MPLPDFNEEGDLPEGVHPATRDELTARFGVGTRRRQNVTADLLKIYNLARATGKLERFLLFGSYVTAKPAPNDVDIFLIMSRDFKVDDYTGTAATLFSHMQAQERLGASVFWVSRRTSEDLIDAVMEGWQTKRGQTRRGIVEVIE